MQAVKSGSIVSLLSSAPGAGIAGVITLSP